MVLKNTLHTADYVIIALVAALSAGIGIFFTIRAKRKKADSNEEFNLGSRKLSPIPVALSTIVSLFSASSMIGMPVEVYTGGMGYVLFGVGGALGAFVAGLIFVPLLYPLKLTSAQEYLELRYRSRSARLTGTFLILLSVLLYTGVTVFSPAVAIEAVTDLPLWAGLLLITGISCLTTMGGIRAVVWTDVMQAVLMLAGIIAVLIQATLKVGGFDRVWELNQDGGRLNFNFDPDPRIKYTFWTLVVAGIAPYMSYHGMNQVSVQRYSSVPSLRSARLVVLLNVPLWIIFVALMTTAGAAVYAYYASIACDPWRGKQIRNVNQIVPYFVVDVMNWPGFPGFYIACLLSGALSSVTSALSASAAVVWEDILKPRLDQIQDWKKAAISRILVILSGAITLGVAFAADAYGGTIIQMVLSIYGATQGPLLGMFLLGALFPCANWIGAVIGGFGGLAMTLWISVGAVIYPAAGSAKLPTNTSQCPISNEITNITSTITTMQSMTTEMMSSMTTATSSAPAEPGLHNLYALSFMWYTAVGMLTTMIVGLLVSFCTGYSRVDETDPIYLMPLCNRLFCGLCSCLPSSCLRCLQCGVDYTEEDNEKMDISYLNGVDHVKTQYALDNPALNTDETKNIQLLSLQKAYT